MAGVGARAPTAFVYLPVQEHQMLRMPLDTTAGDDGCLPAYSELPLHLSSSGMYSLVYVVRMRVRSRKPVTLLSITTMFQTSFKGFLPAP